MAVNFKLSPAVEVDRDADDMSRTWVGFDSTHEPHRTFEANRGLWALGARAQLEPCATFSFEGTVRVVAAIEHIETVPAKRAGTRPRKAIVGRVLPPGDPMHDRWIGRPVDTHRNPVTYLPEPGAPARTCACGCGVTVAADRGFLPGHDQRAVHERITRRWGSSLAFVDWFDTTDAQAAGGTRAESTEDVRC